MDAEDGDVGDAAALAPCDAEGAHSATSILVGDPVQVQESTKQAFLPPVAAALPWFWRLHPIAKQAMGLERPHQIAAAEDEEERAEERAILSAQRLVDRRVDQEWLEAAENALAAAFHSLQVRHCCYFATAFVGDHDEVSSYELAVVAVHKKREDQVRPVETWDALHWGAFALYEAYLEKARDASSYELSHSEALGVDHRLASPEEDAELGNVLHPELLSEHVDGPPSL